MNDLERYPLHYAALCGTLEGVRELLRSGHDINEFDQFGKTPLHYAADEERLEIVQQLIESGADVNAADERTIGNTPLGNVAGRCSYELATILLEAGADPNVPGWMQITPVGHARGRDDEVGHRVYELLSKNQP